MGDVASQDDDRPLLEYDQGSGRDPWWRRGWIVAPLLGVIAGSLLSFVARNALCGLPVLVCGLGATTAMLVRYRKMTFVFVAALAAVMSCAGVETLRHLSAGPMPSPRTLIPQSLAYVAFVILPTLFGGVIAVALDEATRPGRRE